jgi:amino acid permease
MPRRGGYYDKDEIQSSIISIFVLLIGLAISVYFFIKPINAQGKEVATAFIVICVLILFFVIFPLLSQSKMET